MIATMVMNMPSPDDSVKTNLIVVPAALLQQVSILIQLLTLLVLKTPHRSGRTKSTPRRTGCSTFTSIMGRDRKSVV